MGSVTSTLDIVLRDDVSMPAAKVTEALDRVMAKEKAVSASLASSGLRDKFGNQLKTLGAGVTHVEAASTAWAKFAKSQALAANATEWTSAQTAAVKRWETITKASIRSVMEQERAMARSAEASSAAFVRSQAKAATAAEHAAHARRGSGHFDQSTLGGTIATAGAFGFEHMMHSVLERYRDFDKERRYAKVVMGLTDEQQEPLVQQALRGGATSRFNDIQWLEGQREFAARGYKLDQVKAFTPIAADLGTALDVSLPEGVKLLEGAMLGFSKDVSTYEKAVESARRTADLQVKASKISGMDANDLQELYKAGAAPARMAHLSEESLLAFGGISKKSMIGGSESGVAFRGMVKNLLTPTDGAKVAMRTAGIDFSKYQRMPGSLDVEGFSAMVAQRYGVKLTDGVKKGLGKVFSDSKVVGDATAFMPAVVGYLRGALGGKDAKSLKSIAGLAGRYRDSSSQGVDTNGLLHDLIQAMAKNPALANAIFGGKVGGKVFTALGDPKFVDDITEQLVKHSNGFSGQVAEARNEGFNGQMAQLQGAIATLESSIGRAFDANGSGGMLTQAATSAARFVQSLSEMNPNALRAGVEAAAAAAVLAGLKSIDFIKGGFGLKAAGAEMLDAGHVQLQAGRLMLEAAAGRNVPGRTPGVPPGEPAGPHGEPTSKPGDLLKPGETPKGGGKFFGGGGLKGLAGGLMEGVIGGIIYQSGSDAMDWLLGWNAEKQKRFDAEMKYPALHATLDPIVKRGMGRFDSDAALPFMTGEFEGTMERARRSADAFRRDPEGERGQRMMQMFAPLPEAQPYVELGAQRGAAMGQLPAPPIATPIAPQVDPGSATDALFTLGRVSEETGAKMQTALNVTASPVVNMGSLLAYAALLDQVISKQGQLGNIGGGGANALVSARRSFNRAPAGAVSV